jgi:tetratricopeptide (TPR) repeat protein
MAAEKGRYASVEAEYFLMQIYYFYEKDITKALKIAGDSHARFPANMLFHKYLGRSYVSLADWGMVRQVFSDIAECTRRGQRGYGAAAEREAEYYLGQCDMTAKGYETALQHFYRCDELSRSLDRGEPSGFMAMANLKLGMLYDLTSRRDLAIAQYRKVLGMKEYRDSHAQAEQFLKNPCLQ